jgi:hypothetical protein
MLFFSFGIFVSFLFFLLCFFFFSFSFFGVSFFFFHVAIRFFSKRRKKGPKTQERKKKKNHKKTKEQKSDLDALMSPRVSRAIGIIWPNGDHMAQWGPIGIILSSRFLGTPPKNLFLRILKMCPLA